MMDLEFTFDETPWERYLNRLEHNDMVGAGHFLALMAGEDDEALEEAFSQLEDLTIHFDLTDLPAASFSGEAGLRLRREKELAVRDDFWQKLDKSDPLRIYLEEIAHIPVCGDIVLAASDLAVANRTGKNADHLRTKLVNMSLGAVVELAREYTGWGVLLQDLIQEGSVGLWQCTLQYTGRGEDFELVRDWWIRFYLSKAIILQARASGLGQKMRQAMEDYRAVDERLLAELGRNATIDEIAEQMHMSPDETVAVKKMLDNARMLKQARQESDPEDEEMEAEEETRHVEDTALFQMRQRIMDLLSGLSDEDAKLLTLRFGLEGGSPLSPEEAGRKLGLTPEEVVAREASALERLRTTN